MVSITSLSNAFSYLAVYIFKALLSYLKHISFNNPAKDCHFCYHFSPALLDVHFHFLLSCYVPLIVVVSLLQPHQYDLLSPHIGTTCSFAGGPLLCPESLHRPQGSQSLIHSPTCRVIAHKFTFSLLHICKCAKRAKLSMQSFSSRNQ